MTRMCVPMDDLPLLPGCRRPRGRRTSPRIRAACGRECRGEHYSERDADRIVPFVGCGAISAPEPAPVLTAYLTKCDAKAGCYSYSLQIISLNAISIR